MRVFLSIYLLFQLNFCPSELQFSRTRASSVRDFGLRKTDLRFFVYLLEFNFGPRGLQFFLRLFRRGFIDSGENLLGR